MSPSLNSTIVSLGEVPFNDVQTAARSQRPLVMVVDDEQLVADTLSLILLKAGFSTCAAYDGPMAMEMAHEFAPQLLISDIAMPGMSGLELAQSMTGKHPGCRVLFFSGNVTSLQLVELLGDEHPYELLIKPVHPTEMLAHVARLLQVSAKEATPAQPPVPQSVSSMTTLAA